ncbi:hypothetical protein [Pandoraea norimbergensis]
MDNQRRHTESTKQINASEIELMNRIRSKLAEIGMLQAELADSRSGGKQSGAVITDRTFLTTEQLASVLHLRPQSIRKRYMVTGSYHGVRPVKLPNRFLAWPSDAVEQLLSQGSQ